MNLTKKHKAWLENIYDRAIVEARKAAESETAGADAEPDGNTKAMRTENAAEHSLFADALEELKDNIRFL